MNIYFYGRNSDVQSFENGSSLATQRYRVEKYCEMKNWTITRYFEEQCSGAVKLSRRNKGHELLNIIKKNDKIIAQDLSRFSRNSLDLLQTVELLKKKSVDLIFTDIGCVTDGDVMGSLFMKLLSVFYEFEREQTSIRTKRTKQRLKSQGRHAGGSVMFGYDKNDDGFLVPCEKEQQHIKNMLLLRKQGKSYRFISDFMTNSTRKKFALSWVHKIIGREMNEVFEVA